MKMRDDGIRGAVSTTELLTRIHHHLQAAHESIGRAASLAASAADRDYGNRRSVFEIACLVGLTESARRLTESCVELSTNLHDRHVGAEKCA